ncbi:glycosyltransferase family 2 protein [Myxococcota bacterium]|nr:glycosyltransferase family 2 protein [Myxococcota bacterium]
MPSPPLSVLVVTWHGGPLLARCLDALQVQDPPPDELRVVVASAEPSRAPVGQPALVMPRPSGFAASANAGLRARRPGADVLLLNDDTVAQPGFLAALAVARARGGEGIYQPRILLADGSGRLDNSGHHLFPDGFNLARGRGRPDPAHLPAEAGAFSGAAVLLTAEVLDRVGLFDEDLEAFGEDLDLSLRAVRRGFRVRTVPEARILHQLGASYGRAGPRKVHLVQRNHLRAAARSLPATALWTLPLWTGLRLGAMGLSAAAGRGVGADVAPRDLGAVATGLLAGVQALPDALRKRRADAPDWAVGEAGMWRHLVKHRVRGEDLGGA